MLSARTVRSMLPRPARKSSPKRLSSAFTLVEMIAVLVVIALLLGLAAFGYTKFIAGTRETTVKAIAVQVAKAIQGHSAAQQLPYNAANFTSPNPTPTDLVASDIPAGALVGAMIDDEVEGTGELVATVTVRYEGLPADIVFGRDEVATPGRVDGIGVSAGDGTGSGGGGPPPAAPQPTYAALVEQDNPAAWYRLGETSGTTMTDSSGNDRSGTYHNNPALGVPGLVADDPDTALSMDGTNKYGITPYATWMSSPALTAELIYTPATNTGLQVLLGRDNTGACCINRGWYISNDKGTLLVDIFIGSAHITARSDVGSLQIGRAHHIAFSHDGEALRLYLNGAEVAHTPAAGAINDNVSEPLHIGRSPYGGGWGITNGVIDEVAFYTDALDGDLIRAHARAVDNYASPATPAGAYPDAVMADNPDAYWRLDDADPSAVMADASGNDRDGFYGPGTTSVPGLPAGDSNTAARFNGTDGYGQVPGASWMNSADFTAEAAIELSDVTRNSIIISRDNSGGCASCRNWALRIQHGQLHFEVWTGNTYHVISSVVRTIATDHKFHVAVAVADGEMQLYLDGHLVTTKPGIGTPNTAYRSFTIGRTTYPYGYLLGTVDEVAYYTRALGAERIAAHAAAFDGNPGPTSATDTHATTVLADTPAGYWRLDDTDNTARDATGQRRDGYYGGGTQDVPGLVPGNRATTFNGSDGFVHVPGAKWMNSPEFTAEAIIRAPTGTGRMSIVNRDDAGGCWTCRVWGLHTQNGTVWGEIFTNGGVRTLMAPHGTLQAGQIYHVALTYDGTTAKLYVDGTERVSQEINTSIHTAVRELSIGRTQYPAFFYNGTIDEVAYFTRALPPARIAAHASS